MFQQHEIKQEVRAYIKDNPKDLGTTFSFELIDGKPIYQNVQWIEKGKEFTLNGEMYDVISIRWESNKVTVHAINDKAEKALKQTYARHHKGKHQLSLSQFATVLFLPGHSQIILDVPETYFKINYGYRDVGFNQLHLPVIVPPPDNI